MIAYPVRSDRSFDGAIHCGRIPDVLN